MKSVISIFSGIMAMAMFQACAPSASDSDADHLVILHTNDTHSQIDPDRHNLGGIARRKVLVDSVRAERQNVLLVDAGDAVQGSLYYTIFGGEVERKLMNEMGYDIRILGNHEFDKGLDVLAREWKQIDGTRLSTNYDFEDTPLDGLFVPSVIKEYNGHKIGFIGVNLDPKGIIVEDNYGEMEYEDAIEEANKEAARLKKEGAEMVIAISHIGYDNEHDYDDLTLARRSHDIDVIIGGHSHTLVTPTDNPDAPKWIVPNADGKNVTIVQTGSTGTYLGEIDIDLKSRDVSARVIPVTDRLDSRIDTTFTALITPYREKVDSIRSIKIGTNPAEMERKSPELLNFMSDFVMMRGRELSPSGKVDLAIMNKGGLRNSLPAGDITAGAVIDIAPFDNSIVVMEIKGEDLIDNFKVMAAQEGQGVSSNVKALYDPSTHELNSVTIDGKPIDPDRRYILATIDYLADGNDYMEPLKEGKILARSNEVLYQILINKISNGSLDKLLNSPDHTRRMTSM
ncbi:MAG: bifunctional metallophosphatase/5'-nucleotidase [Lachnoclostridium sp.]|nr:bifunctional metallophosphatase/5'-nucleotidase [Lachnoclostridium sp.]